MMGGYGESVDKLLWTLQTIVILIGQMILMHINEAYANISSSVMSGGNSKN